jgi:beta-lactamase superfamily II metal-dependent hydrolase
MSTPIRVRMYRPGFGDCFLISFGNGSGVRHVLIDFGAHMHGEIGTMDQIMDDLEKTSLFKLEVLVATHAHRDHISGFGKFADRFATFDIGEVWLPWTDNPRDKKAAALKKKHLALYDALEQHLQLALKANPTNLTYAAALDALSNLKGNETATSELARAFGTGAKVRYFEAGLAVDKVGHISGLSAELLGPPRDDAFLSRMNPPGDQHFLSAPDGTTTSLRPFPNLEIRSPEADYAAIVQEGQPVVADPDLVHLHDAAAAPAERLALALDSVRNNTSLVILFRYRGKSLLFPGDAQWGSWQSWIGTDKSRQLLNELDFLKVAHHGSENATPVDLVQGLKGSGLAVMVPTQIQPFPTIPREPLLKEIEKHCEGHVAVRSDWIEVQGAPVGPTPIPALPKGFTAGKIWIDYEF